MLIGQQAAPMDDEDNRKSPIVLDWNELLPNGKDDEPPAELVVAGDKKRSPPVEEEKPPENNEFAGMSDSYIQEQINKFKGHLRLPNLKDNGEKLWARIKLFEAEQERRKIQRENDDGREKLSESKKQSCTNVSSDLLETTPSPPQASESKFGTCYKRKLDEKHTGTRVVNAFENEFSYFGHGSNRNSLSKGQDSTRGQHKSMISSRQTPFKCATKLSADAKKCNKSAGDHPKSTWSSITKKKKSTSPSLASKDLMPWHGKTFVLIDEDEPKPDLELSVDATKCNISSADQNQHLYTPLYKNFNKISPDSFMNKKSTSQFIASNDSRPRKGIPFHLVDEDEDEPEPEPEPDPELELIEHMEEVEEVDEWFNESMKDCKINYPSSDDPESVEISYSNMQCLAPEAFLSSDIMNFYICYLQQPELATKRGNNNYHLFNTYFYTKLVEAVPEDGDESSFSRLRRWWKGVDIFQKAYILLPINEERHWSLAIIAMPDKEDNSGPIILHLDSLKLHNSTSVFKNIKRFLSEEWEHLNQGVPLRELPFSNKIWNNLPYRIEESRLPVPQQSNDFDCGLFVLYFMERFMAEAPKRLKRRNLEMFGKNWFRPEEASNLRPKMKKLLKKEFLKATKDKSVPTQFTSMAAQEHKFEQPIEYPNIILVDPDEF